MEQTLAKRLVFFTQVLAVLWIVSVVGLLQKLDAEEFQRDLEKIQILERVYRNQTHPDAEKTLEGVKDWLARDKPDIAKARRNVRQDLTDWLEDQGVPQENLRNLTFKSEAGQRGEIVPFYVIEVEPDTEDVVGRGTEQALQLLASQTKPRMISIATGVETEGVDLGFSHETSPGSLIEVKLIKVRLIGTQIEVVQEMIDPIIQVELFPKTTYLSATVKEVPGPSLWQFNSGDFNRTDEVVGLGRSPQILGRLNNSYGHLSLEAARSRVSQGLSSSLEKINILGFSFAPSWVPLAVLAGDLVAMIGIFSVTWKVRTSGYQVFGGDVDSGTLKFLIDHPVLRFASWVLLPILAVWLALPAVPLGMTLTFILIAGSVALFVLGLASVIQSLLR